VFLVVRLLMTSMPILLILLMLKEDEIEHDIERDIEAAMGNHHSRIASLRCGTDHRRRTSKGSLFGSPPIQRLPPFGSDSRRRDTARPGVLGRRSLSGSF